MREGEQERNRKSCRRERGEGKCVSVTFQRDTRKSVEKRRRVGKKRLYIHIYSQFCLENVYTQVAVHSVACFVCHV